MDESTAKNMQQYDDHADEWRTAMSSNVGHIFLEKPAMTKMLPHSLTGLVVLCIGVGSGEELLEIAKRGAQKIVAIDISKKLLKIAAKHFPQVELIQMDMLELEFADQSFDFVYSSLAFHYAKDWDKLLTGVARILKQNGTLLFSAHNPAFWGKYPTTGLSHINRRGVCAKEHFAELPGSIEITYYNVSDASIIREAVEYAGISITDFSFPELVPITDKVTTSMRGEYTRLENQNDDVPLFLIVKGECNLISRR